MKMLQFAFVAVLAMLPVSNLSMELTRFPLVSLQDARLGNLQEVCKLFCGDQYYHDYFFRALDDVVQPRIFCGLCKKKISPSTSTTTTSKTTTSPPSSTTSSTATSTSTATTTTTTATPTTAPTTTTPSTVTPTTETPTTSSSTTTSSTTTAAP